MNTAREQGECSDDMGRGEDWLQSLLVAAEIIAITPDSAP